MGLIPDRLGPDDQRIIRILEPEVIRVLRNASELVKSGKGKLQSKMWFGDKSDGWMKSLGKNLNWLASMVNNQPIKVSGTDLKERDPGGFAAALRPEGGWKKYENMTKAQNRDFKIELDSKWNTAQMFRIDNTPADTKFSCVVHELTHLFLKTDDVEPSPYGVENCKSKANNNADGAKRNASNWEYFVEDMRNPVFPAAVTSKEWQELTARNALHTRSADLGRLDRALVAYEKSETLVTAQELVAAFTNWYSQNPHERIARNVNSIVDRLKNYVDSL